MYDCGFNIERWWLIMASATNSRRIAAKCAHCAQIYAAAKLADGTIQPIGLRAGCRCGGETFHVLGEAADRAD